MIERVCDQEKILAIIVRNQYHRDGIEFFTPGEFSQQLAYMNRPKHYRIPPHVHNKVVREVQLTQEVLFIKSGEVRIDFYTANQQFLESRILYKGDVILLADGGHGITMLTDAEILEVKQGPYAGDKDKTRFQGIDSENTQ